MHGVKLNSVTKRPRDNESLQTLSSWIKPQPCGKTLTGTVLSEGERIPILVQPVSIKDGPPEVGEIAVTVRKLR